MPLGGALLALLAGGAYWHFLSGSDQRPLSDAPGAGVGGEIPEIALGRVDKTGAHGPLGRRDIFRYGAMVVPGEQVALQPPRPTPPPMTMPTPPPRMTPALPPMNVHFIGTLEVDKRGLKVAVLLTDQKEVLTGQAGDIVANRFRIIRIGLESVDVQDMGSDSVRRIPLGGS